MAPRRSRNERHIGVAGAGLPDIVAAADDQDTTTSTLRGSESSRPPPAGNDAGVVWTSTSSTAWVTGAVALREANHENGTRGRRLRRALEAETAAGLRLQPPEADRVPAVEEQIKWHKPLRPRMSRSGSSRRVGRMGRRDRSPEGGTRRRVSAADATLEARTYCGELRDPQ